MTGIHVDRKAPHWSISREELIGRIEIPDFEPFEGYVGITAATGSVTQSHTLHSLRILNGDRRSLRYAPAPAPDFDSLQVVQLAERTG